MLDASGTDWAFVHRVTGRFGYDLRYSVEIRRVQAELEYKPLLPFEQGLADVVQRYRDNPAWLKPLRGTRGTVAVVQRSAKE